MLPIEVKVLFKNNSLEVWYFDSYGKAFELVNNLEVWKVQKVEINFKN